MPKTDKVLAQHVRSVISDNSMSYARFAQWLDLHPSTISGWLYYGKRPDLACALLMAGAAIREEDRIYFRRLVPKERRDMILKALLIKEYD